MTSEPIRAAALVLEGGGMRGVYTAGVLDCLMDAGLFFQNIYGVSAGACHACSYVSRQRGRALRAATEYLRDRRYAGFYSLLTSGDYFGVPMAYDEIPNRLIPFNYDAYLNSGMLLRAVVTNCATGKAEYLPTRDLRRDMDLIRASSSLPFLSRVVWICGQPYLDGGIADSIPLARSISDGNQKNLIVLTREASYRKKADPAPGAGFVYPAYPELVRGMRGRHVNYNSALDLASEEVAAGRAVIIRPSLPPAIGRLEKNRGRLLALYREGIADMTAKLDEVRRLLFSPK